VSPAAVRVIRRILLFTLVLGLVGTGIELLLLEHFEEWRQMIPLGLIACALLVLIWHGLDRGPTPVRTLQVVMTTFAFAGLAGLTLHYKGNVEFELEMYPSRAGFELFREAMMGATPALAPGSMIQIALIGLAYSYSHPRLTRGRTP
jgi:hypothetical protein